MLKRRIFVALLSMVIFSLILAFISYTPISGRASNTWYESFSSLLIVFLMFSGPAYLLGGVPVSMWIDKYIHSEIVKLPLYLVGGFVVGVLTILISFRTFVADVLWFGVYGLFASLLFFGIMLITSRLKLALSKD